MVVGSEWREESRAFFSEEEMRDVLLDYVLRNMIKGIAHEIRGTVTS